MTPSTPLDAWLASRTPSPPPQLADRVRALAAAELGQAATPADALLAAAERAVESLLRSGGLTRESALDLLAVDALVTYAFEAAADEPQALEARAERALARIAALAEPYGA